MAEYNALEYICCIKLARFMVVLKTRSDQTVLWQRRHKLSEHTSVDQHGGFCDAEYIANMRLRGQSDHGILVMGNRRPSSV